MVLWLTKHFYEGPVMLKLHRHRAFTITELAHQTRLNKGKVRFYLKNVLQDYIDAKNIKVAHGKTAVYPSEVLSRLRFIKMAKEELETSSGDRLTPTLAELRGWMNNLTDEQVEAVLNGDDTLEFGITRIEKGARVIETIRGEKLSGDSGKYGARIPATPKRDERSKDKRDSAPVDSESWARERFGDFLEIRYARPLTDRQLKQLRSAGELLRNILGEEK